MKTDIAKLGKRVAIEKLFEAAQLNRYNDISLFEEGRLFSVQKVLQEGINFDLIYNPLKHLGYKSMLSVLGELYAKFAKPMSMQILIGVSQRFSYEDIEELFLGMSAALKEHSVEKVSLDLIPSINGLSLSLNALGLLENEISEKKPEAKTKDLICLSGNVGAAYMGLQVLEREKAAFVSSSQDATIKQPDLSNYKYILEAYLSPSIKKNIREQFQEDDIIPTSGVFVTDGLGAAVKKLCKQTGLGAKIYMQRIPISSRTFSMAEEVNIDALTAALNGGDDYKFLFTIPIEKSEIFMKEFVEYDVIGHLATEDVGAVLLTPDGAEVEISAQGW